MPLTPRELRRELRRAGIQKAAVDAVWPQWWSDDAAKSASATAQLTYTVARRLGLSPGALFDGSAQFLWRDETKFKKLDARSTGEEGALASFGNAVGACAIRATEAPQHGDLPDAQALRQTILRQGRLVDALQLLNVCWAIGIPVLQPSVLPLAHKRMHAMTVRVDRRYAIIIGYRSRYAAPLAYILAHEIGHIFLGHLSVGGALVEMGDPLLATGEDEEEAAADRFALAVLTGEEDPRVLSNSAEFGARQVAEAAMAAAADHAIDPGVLALCLGHETKKWREVYGALKIIPPREIDTGAEINRVASSQLRWDEMSLDSQEYLSAVLGVRRDG